MVLQNQSAPVIPPSPCKSYLSPNIIWGDQIKKNERLVRQVNEYGRGGVHTGFWWGYLRGGDHLEDQDIDGGILKWTFKSGMKGYGMN